MGPSTKLIPLLGPLGGDDLTEEGRGTQIFTKFETFFQRVRYVQGFHLLLKFLDFSRSNISKIYRGGGRGANIDKI